MIDEMKVLLFLVALMYIFFIVLSIKTIVRKHSIGFITGYWIGICFFILSPIVIFFISGGIFEKPVMKNLTMLRDANIDNALGAVCFLTFCSIISFATLYFMQIKVKNISFISINYSSISVNTWIYFSFSFYIVIILTDSLLNGMFSSEAHWYRSRHDNMVSSSGSLYVLLGYIKQSIKVIFPSILIYYWYKKNLSTRVFLTMYILFLLIDVYVTGNRFIIASTMVLIFILLIYKKEVLKISLLSSVSLPIMWFGTIYMQVRQEIHGVSLSNISTLFYEKSLNSDTGFLNLLKNSFEGINFNTFVSIFNDFPTRIDFLYGSSIIKPIVALIPRDLWENKPERISQVIGKFYSGDEYLSLVTTFFGEGWGNFGYLFFILLPLFIIFKYVFIKALLDHYEFSVTILFLLSFSLIRSSFSAVIMEAFFISIVLSLLCFLIYLFKSFVKSY